MRPDGFYPEFYLQSNPDIAQSSHFGWDFGQAERHYIHWGIREGRPPNIFFDPHYYVNYYGDLKNHFGNDFRKLLEHWLMFGIKEGRRGSPIFDSRFYLEYHPDLKRSYGNNYFEAYAHWINHGIKEQRRTVPEVETSLFTPDLKVASLTAEKYFSSIPTVGAVLIPIIYTVMRRMAAEIGIRMWHHYMRNERLWDVKGTGIDWARGTIERYGNERAGDREFYREVNEPGSMDLPGRGHPRRDGIA